MLLDSITKILVFVSACSIVHGCMCLKGHHQEEFCRANYVIRGEVTMIVENKSIVTYTVKVSDLFKDESKTIEKDSVIQIKSNKNGARCGIKLQTGDFLLGGRFDGHGYSIGLCDIATKWTEVPECQRKAILNNLYDCECGITACNEKEICKSSTNSCKMAFPAKTVQNAYCSRVQSRCKWTTCPSQHDLFYSLLRKMLGQ